MTLTVEACCNGGLRLTYHVPAMGGQPAATLTVDSPMDGTEVAVLLNGKPSGETMAIKRVDAFHMSGVVKMNDQLFVTSSSTRAGDEWITLARHRRGSRHAPARAIAIGVMVPILLDKSSRERPLA